MLRAVRGLGFALALAAMPHVGAAQTREFLDAPRVESRIRVRWNAKDKKITYEIDGDQTPRELVPDALFLTSTSVFVTYPKINPLKLQVTAAVSDVDDPSHATIAKLLEAILGVATIVKPEAAKAGTGAPPSGIGATAGVCTELVQASGDLATLNEKLFGTATTSVVVKGEVENWASAIDVAYGNATSGAAAIATGVAEIGLFETTLAGVISEAGGVVARVEARAAEAGPFTGCPQQAHELYQLIRLTNPRVRIQQLSALKTAAAELRKTLQTDYVDADGQWLYGTEYKISREIKPTGAKMQKVVVKAAAVSFKVDDVTSALVVSQQETGSVAFTVRRYSAFAPEIGVGAVFGLVNRPQYGTSKNAAGQTIVARVPDDDFSVNPSVLANFVCRCGGGGFAPMLQVGASTSKDVPAILLGGGLRLFGAGAGDVAIGGGWMLAWVKDLQALKEGDVVGGTKEIEADLGVVRTPRVRAYFVIQYKF